VIAFDPVAKVDGVDQAATVADAVVGADVVILVTSWPDFADVPALLAGTTTLVVDGRRMWRPDQFAQYRGPGLS